VYPTQYNYTGDFPSGFVWGVGTASYQIEGAYNEDGRGASIWDTFTGANTVGMIGSICNEMPCPINSLMKSPGATGNVACDTYHTYKADVQMMVAMGLKHYRFSVSWPRVVPTGVVADGVNERALQYYDDLIDELLANGITPYVTLYHWDLPQALLNSANGTYGWYATDEKGHPSYQIVQHFVDYAGILFARYGDRVRTWVTFNEAWTFLYLGSGYGKAPSTPEYGDVCTWPYIGAHTVLIAHARVVELYRSKYQRAQEGKIGMTNNVDWREPKTPDPLDVGASERSVEFWLGWFTDPLYLGDYPASMRALIGSRLPAFTAEEKTLLKGSVDFFGLNHYGTGWVTNSPDAAGFQEYYGIVDEVGPPYTFPKAQSAWLYGAGWGLRKLLNWIATRYGNPDIYITEGGWSLQADTAAEAQHDMPRTMYYANYTSEILKAINEDRINVRGYFAWSLMDNFEWEMGYTERFGLVFDDFKFGLDPNTSADSGNQPTAAGQVRTPKDSACWFKKGLWTTNALVDPSAAATC
jgi:beta-glucosidase